MSSLSPWSLKAGQLSSLQRPMASTSSLKLNTKRLQPHPPPPLNFKKKDFPPPPPILFVCKYNMKLLPNNIKKVQIVFHVRFTDTHEYITSPRHIKRIAIINFNPNILIFVFKKSSEEKFLNMSVPGN